MVAGLRMSLNCEQLEPRENPSNVTVVYNSAHNLIITGDNGNNVFILEENLAGDYYVTAGTGTTVNGSSFVQLGVIHPVIIEIADGNGDDHMAVYGVHPSYILGVRTGNGNDFVNLSGVTTDYVGVKLGNGSNLLETNSVVALKGAMISAGYGKNEWIDNGFKSDGYLGESGWGVISE